MIPMLLIERCCEEFSFICVHVLPEIEMYCKECKNILTYNFVSIKFTGFARLKIYCPIKMISFSY